MSLYDPQKSWTVAIRRIVAIALAIGVVPLLAACGNGGFRPLHGNFSGEASASEKFAAMDIAPIPGRVGQRLRNELIFEKTGGGTPVPHEYRLDIAIKESVSSTLVQRDADALGEVYNLTARFRLIRLSDQKEIMNGTSIGRASYERVVSSFANVRARRDAEDRAAKTVATDLRARLSAVLATSA